jgi:membrane protein
VRKRIITFSNLVRQTFIGWWEDKAPRFGAALAYYSVLSLAPLLVLTTPLANWLFGAKLARGELVAQFERLVGHDGAEVVAMLIAAAAERPAPTFATRILGGAVVLFAASAVFAELQDALDTIWEVTPRPGKSAFFAFIRKRFLSFAMVLAIAFLLLVSLVISTTFELVQQYIDTRVHGLVHLWSIANFVISFLVVTLLFAMVYKILPDAKIGWRDVWVGAAITSGLFAAGKYAIGFYLGHSTFGAYYGAAGSLVVFLVWVYYSSQILLLGAEFTHAYAVLRGKRIRPEPIAVPITEEARAQQGIPHKETVERAVEEHDQRTG